MTTEIAVYALDMPKYVFVQITGVEKPARIRGDKVEATKTGGLTIKIGEEKVGEFNPGVASGWWIEDEPKAT